MPDYINLRISECAKDLLQLTLINCNNFIKASFKNSLSHILRIAQTFSNEKILKDTEDLHCKIDKLKQEHQEHIQFFKDSKDKHFFKLYEQTAATKIQQQLIEILELEKQEKSILIQYQMKAEEVFLKIEKFL